ncbi:MAG: Wzz/FepE/Etk N-terminal domain-containing protein, partial [Intestinibacter sp.]|uniref:polysaccharide biosynthesis tyrosine autokinase n=1 Tax=Intestinibacter sp. TaxID=1965304 RepID=UPI0025B808B2
MDNIVEIDLRKILKIIRKNILILIISTFVCGLGAFVVSRFVMPQLYQATTTLIVNRNLSEENKDEYANSPYAVTDLEYFRKIASTYMEILTSKTILNQIIEKFDLDIKYEDYLKDYIEVETLNNTEVIQVNILDENPDRAMKICNTIPSLFEEEVVRITKVAGIEVIDKASLPEEVEKPNLILFTLLGLVGGFILGLMIIFFKQILDNKIKNKEDIEAKLKITLLGQIPKIKDMKHKVILADDNLNMDAAESFLKIRTNLEFSNIDNKNNVIVFTSTNKGEGKSTTICNNSVFFSRLENKRVLLVDCDLREPKVHKIMDINNKIGLVELLKGKKEFDDVVQRINDNLDVITAGQKIINQVDILSSQKMK